MFTSRDLSREAFGSTARYGLNHLILRCWWVNICVIYIDFSNWNVRFHPFFQHPRQKREWGRTNLSATITSINYGETSFNLALTALMLLKIIDNLRGSARWKSRPRGSIWLTFIIGLDSCEAQLLWPLIQWVGSVRGNCQMHGWTQRKNHFNQSQLVLRSESMDEDKSSHLV